VQFAFSDDIVLSESVERAVVTRFYPPESEAPSWVKHIEEVYQQVVTGNS
jgi:hypothetical protein